MSRLLPVVPGQDMEESLTLLDVYRDIEGDKPILHQDTHTNPDCGVGVNNKTED